MSAAKSYRLRVWRGSQTADYDQQVTRRELDLLRRFGQALGVLGHGDFGSSDLVVWDKSRRYGDTTILGEKSR